MTLNKCKKLSYYFLNFILLFSGIIEFIISILLIVWMNEYKLFLSIKLFLPHIIIIFLQVIIVLTFWLSCKGIKEENKTFVLIICFLFITKILIEIGIGLYIFMLRDEANDVLKVNMDKSFEKYVVNIHKKEDWIKIERTLSCCGVDGINSYVEKQIDFIPISCCNSTLENTSVCNGGFFQKGCLDALTEYIKYLLMIFGQVVFLFVVIQILGMSLFCRIDIDIIKKDIISKNMKKRRSEIQNERVKKKLIDAENIS